MNQELELYKLCVKPDDEDIRYVREMGWENSEFLVWISYVWLKDFMDRFKQIFGADIFAEGSFGGVFLEDCVCFDLCEAVGYAVDLENIFPKDKYKH